MTDRALPATPSRPAPHQDQLIEPEINCQLRGAFRLRCTTDLSIRGWYLLPPTGIPAIPRRVEPDRAGPAVARRVVAAVGVKGRMCGTLTGRISIGVFELFRTQRGDGDGGESFSTCNSHPATNAWGRLLQVMGSIILGPLMTAGPGRLLSCAR